MTQSTPANKLIHLVAATDFSELGDRAVLSAMRLAKAQAKSELHVIAVAMGEGIGLRLPWEEGQPLRSQEEAEQMMKERVAKLIEPEVPACEEHIESINIYLTVGNPAVRIVQLASHVDAEMIVIGTHGRTGLSRLVLGSVAEAVVQGAPCTVLVIRPRDFVAGSKVPDVQPALAEGAHSLKPFHRAHTHHYVDRGSRASGRVLPAG